MTKPVLPRRAVLRALRVMASNVRNMISVWGWTPGVRRYRGEDPASSRDEWVRLSLYADAIERQAASIRRFAEEQISANR